MHHLCIFNFWIIAEIYIIQLYNNCKKKQILHNFDFELISLLLQIFFIVIGISFDPSNMHSVL